MEKILILLLASLLLFEPPVLSHLICANQAVKIQSGNKKKPKKFGSYFLIFFFVIFLLEAPEHLAQIQWIASPGDRFDTIGRMGATKGKYYRVQALSGE